MKKIFVILMLSSGVFAASCGSNSNNGSTTTQASGSSASTAAPVGPSTTAAQASGSGPCVTTQGAGATAGSDVAGLGSISSAELSPQGSSGTEPTVYVPSGQPPTALQGADLIVGNGQAVSASSTVTVKYVGCSWTNKVLFDASWSDGSGGPATFPLNGVIPGWSKGLVGMMVGGRRELIIPPSLAYGSQTQAGGKIAANDTLIFVVDLVSVS